MTANDTAAQTRDILRPHLTGLAPDQPIPPDARLRDLGLNSVGAINLLVELERRLGLVFPDSMLNEETFRTYANLTRAVTQLVRDRP